MLAVSNQTVYKWLRTGAIQGGKVGGTWRIRPEAVERFLRKFG